MKETPQDYTKRILGNVEGQNPLKILAGTSKKLDRLIKGVPASKLRKRPAPEKWSVAEILAHLADVEIAVGWRLRQILGAPGTPIQAYDQDSWAAAGHYAKRDPRKCVEQIRVVRAGTVEAPRHACRAGRGDHRAHRSYDRRARHQPYETGRADRGGEEEIRVES